MGHLSSALHDFEKGDMASMVLGVQELELAVKLFAKIPVDCNVEPPQSY